MKGERFMTYNLTEKKFAGKIQVGFFERDFVKEMSQ